MSADQEAVAVLFGWESNCRLDAALAMRHRLCGISTYGLSGLRKGDEHPAYVPIRSMALVTFKE